MECPKCGTEITNEQMAAELGKKGGSQKKNFTQEEIKLRQERMAKARENRWAK